MNFQFGNFYNGNSDFVNLIGTLLGSLLGAVISGIIAITIFNRGLKKEEEKEKQKVLRDIERDYKTFLTLLESVVKNVKEQIIRFEDFINQINDNPLSNSVPKMLTHQDLDRILKMGTSNIIELYDYLDVSNDSYLKTIKELDYVNAVLKSMHHDIAEVKENSIPGLSNTFIQTKNEILQILSQYLSGHIIEPNSFEAFINNQMGIYFSHLNNETVDLNYEYENLITPLRTRILADFNQHPLAFEILTRTKRGADIIHTIRQINKGFADDLLTVKGHINEAVTNLEVIIRLLKDNPKGKELLSHN